MWLLKNNCEKNETNERTLIVCRSFYGKTEFLIGKLKKNFNGVIFV